MGAAAAPIAAVTSIAAAGVQAYGSYEAGAAEKAGDEYRAAELDRAAQYGELKAKQTNAQMTRNLTITLGHIDAVRAAARTDPNSPTGAAVRDYAEQVGTEQKNIQVASIEEQARQSEADAAYMRFAGSRALLAGDVSAVSSLLKGAAGAVSSLGPGGGGGAPNYVDPSEV